MQLTYGSSVFIQNRNGIKIQWLSNQVQTLGKTVAIILPPIRFLGASPFFSILQCHHDPGKILLSLTCSKAVAGFAGSFYINNELHIFFQQCRLWDMYFNVMHKTMKYASNFKHELEVLRFFGNCRCCNVQKERGFSFPFVCDICYFLHGNHSKALLTGFQLVGWRCWEKENQSHSAFVVWAPSKKFLPGWMRLLLGPSALCTPEMVTLPQCFSP